MTRGNQRDTDRARALARAAKAGGQGKSNLKTAEADAAAMRAKQQAALERKAKEAAVNNVPRTNIVVKQRFDIK
jgi:hypothetical protein